MYIEQLQRQRLAELVAPGKVVVVYGPRRVGKTTLLNRFAEAMRPEALMVSGEDISVRTYLESESIEMLRSFVSGRRTLIIDEAQHVRRIGLNLKLVVDHVPGLEVIASGSYSFKYSFELAQQTGEPLTGRQFTLLLLPLSQMELQTIESRHETLARLETRLIYGAYPEVVLLASDAQRAQYIKELSSAYLFRDILQLEGVRHADKLLRLLQLLAFQIGKDVSVAELAANLSLGKQTVERYLDLLEKAYIIYGRKGFSRNLRKEISKSRRYYFLDNGIRNGVITHFAPLSLRDDVGQLWENYVLAERMKRNIYQGRLVESYFWRTHDRQKIDLVEESDGRLAGAEMKWSAKSSAKPPAAWRRAYPESGYSVVHPEDYLDFIGVGN